MCNENELISRRMAIDALAEHEKSAGHNYTLFVDIVSECAEIIRHVPSAQPETCEGCRRLSKRENTVQDFNELLKAALDKAREQVKGNGCWDCAFAEKEEWEMPCRRCKWNCKDYWRAKHQNEEDE